MNLVIDDVGFTYPGGAEALRGVSLRIQGGESIAFIGENGAGKTTLMKHLLGALTPEEGAVRVFGTDPTRNPTAVLSQIGYLSEDRDLPDWMRVGELMSYTRAFFPRWDDGLAGQLLSLFELDPGQKIRTLSRGQRARTGLLIAVAHRPDLLVLDEPSSGLDPAARQDILAAVVRTVAEEGRTVLFSSHLLHEVQRVADHVAMLHRGRLVLNEPLDAILARHSLITLHFSYPLAAPPDLPGALGWSGQGDEWTGLCDGQAAQLKTAAAEAGATVVEGRPATLEEVFLGRRQNAAARSPEP